MEAPSMQMNKSSFKSFELSFAKTGKFTDVVKKYQEEDKSLLPFLKQYPSTENFASLAEAKLKDFGNRDILVRHFSRVYKEQGSDEQKNNIAKLALENTVTVTTGHQLAFAGGPLYFIYKAIHTIKLAETLNKQLQDVNVVPVFWLASEDHDFDEIAQITIFGKKHALKKSDNLIPVGDLNIQDVKELKDFALGFFEGFESEALINATINDAWERSNNLSDFTFNLLNTWFANRGLLVLDPQTKELKSAFSNIVAGELESNLVETAVNRLTDKFPSGLKIQAPPRPCNLFFIKDGNRYRIDRKGEGFELMPGNIEVSKDELLASLKSDPQLFSPNVLMRTLYQECILPNIAYIGGGGEMAYWLQLADLFEEVKLPLPQIMLRNSFQLVDSGVSKKIEKLALSPEEIFLSEQILIDQLIADSDSGNLLDFSDFEEQATLLFNNMAERAKSIDPTLAPSIEGQGKGVLKSIEGIQKKLKKRLKEKQEVEINQISTIQQRLFPGGGLQERSENVLHYLAKHGDAFFDYIYEESGDIKPVFKLIYLP